MEIIELSNSIVGGGEAKRELFMSVFVWIGFFSPKTKLPNKELC